jgi:hypothetical protein
MSSVSIPARQAKIAADVDVLVVGGGAGGIGAAVGAAQAGASVAIVEYFGGLGGLLTQGHITSCEAGVVVSGDNILVKGVFEKLVDKMVARGGAIRGYELAFSNKYYPFDTSRCENDLQITPWDPEAFKISADELMSENGVQAFYYTQMTDVLMDGNEVTGIEIENRSGHQVILAKRIIDCTGNLAVARAAGAECEGLGRTGSMTLMFRVGGVRNVTPSYKPHVKEVPYGAVNFFPLLREGEFRVEMTRYRGDDLDAADWTKGTIECRQQCVDVLDYLKKNWVGFDDAYMIDSAPSLGSLAFGHIKGVKRMTSEIILNQEVMDDRIAITGYGIDLHSPEPGGQNVIYYLNPGDYYGVPYGVLVPQSSVENLLVAGKCAASDADASSSVLCSGICMATGEAAGVASAVSIKQDIHPRDIDVHEVQRVLLDNGAIIDPVPVPTRNSYPVYQKPSRETIEAAMAATRAARS